MTSSPQGFSVALLASDEAVRVAASSVLVECAYKVTTAASVEECLQLCTMQRIDIVLAESRDLTASPEMSLQLMSTLQGVPLIVISDDDAPGAVFHGLKIGAVDFLKWPLDKAKVQSMWQHTLQTRRVGVSSLGEEGPQAPRRGPTSAPPPQDAPGAPGVGRMGGGSVPSEGSTSNQLRETMQSTSESSAVAAKMTEAMPATQETAAQNFRNEMEGTGLNMTSAPVLLPSTAGPSIIAAPTTNQTGSEPRKRAHKSTGKQSKRRITPKLSNRDAVSSGSSSHPQPSASSDSMIRPQLLGIPPGCVPPVGSNGQAIGMPFLNQHPFVPSTPMSVGGTSFGCMPPFMYTQPGDQEMMGVSSSASFDASLFASCPFPQFQPPSGPQTPPQSRPFVDSRGFSKEHTLHRVSSSPTAMTPPLVPEVMAATEEVAPPDSPSHRTLRKSPSLVNF